MSPRPDVSEERKNQIIEAAMNVFSRQGFHEARMDDIAQEAGLSKGALYLYYKSKDAIIAAILKSFFALEMRKIRSILDAGSDLSIDERLLSINHFFAADLKWLSTAAPIMFEFYAVAARQKGVRQSLKEYFKEYRDLVASFIQRSIDQGEILPGDAEQIAVMIASLYEGLVLLWMIDPQAVQWEEMGAASIRILLVGLRAGDTTRPIPPAGNPS
jgi:AcrR family transcriptional regulator